MRVSCAPWLSGFPLFRSLLRFDIGPRFSYRVLSLGFSIRTFVRFLGCYRGFVHKEGYLWFRV